MLSKQCPFELFPEDSRLTTYPLFRPGLFKWYEDAESAFWSAKEIDWGEDGEHFRTRLNVNEKHLVKTFIAFFAASDGIINVNNVERFRKEVKILEAQYFYDMQIAVENVHALTYSMALDTIIEQEEERYRLLNAIKTMPIIAKISEYMFRTIDSDAPFAERLLRQALVEGVFFRGAFAFIYWLQSRGLMPGLGQSNKLISIDEGLHATFAMFLYYMLLPWAKLSRERIVEIVREAVALAHEFMAECFTRDGVMFALSEMNCNMMCDYLEAEADNLIALIDEPPIYGTKHNLRYMEQINLKMRTNFFERRAAEYSKQTKSTVVEVIDTNF